MLLESGNTRVVNKTAFYQLETANLSSNIMGVFNLERVLV